MQSRRALMQGLFAVPVIASTASGREPFPDEFDPYHDCPVLLTNESRARWIYEAIALLITLADTYRTINDDISGGYDQQLTSIARQLDAMQRQLDDISASMDHILETLEKLPGEIGHVIDRSLVKQALGFAQVAMGRLSDNTSPSVIDSRLSDISKDIRGLEDITGGIRGVQGLAAAATTAQIVAAWMSAKVAYEKALKKADPSHRVDSPWGTSFLKTHQSMVVALYQQIMSQDSSFQSVIKNIPPHLTPLIYSNTFSEDPKGGRKGDFRISCPTIGINAKQESLQVALEWTSSGGIWADVSKVPGRAQRDPGVIDAWAKIVKDREPIQNFYQICSPIVKRRKPILAVYVEPTDVWKN